MVRPTLLNCGHMYCLRCLESNAAHSSNCCLCRQVQNPDEFIPSAFTEKLINEYLKIDVEYLHLDQIKLSIIYAEHLIVWSGLKEEKLLA